MSGYFFFEFRLPRHWTHDVLRRSRYGHARDVLSKVRKILPPETPPKYYEDIRSKEFSLHV
jgi:hypothetical protein